MSYGATFLRSLKKNPAWRAGLLAALNATDDTLCAYYACSLVNLPSIVELGIKCHDDAHSGQHKLVDLSSFDVQAKRGTVDLGMWDGKYLVTRDETPAHNCVNMFWNPLNWTLDAFQRNALIASESTEDPTLSVVCIIEVNAQEILTCGENLWWCATNRNLAGGAADVSYTAKQLLDRSKFSWTAIFESTHPTTSHDNAIQSAELLVYVGERDEFSSSLPSSYFRRVLCAEQHVNLVRNALRGCGSKLGIVSIDAFKQTDDLLHAERKLINSIALKRDQLFIYAFTHAFADLVAFEDIAGPVVEAEFTAPNMAYNVHGIGHIVRVTFWAAVLSRYSNIRAEIRPAALAAARYHDLCRVSNASGVSHAEAAAERFAPAIRELLDDNTLAERSISAIRDHDDDDAGQMDVVLSILKDADALDRGRFDTPNSINGCDASRLRTPGIRRRPGEDGYSNIPWAARWIARMTQHTDWGAPSPSREFAEQVGLGLRAAIRTDESAAGGEPFFKDAINLELATRVSKAALDAANQ
ncbi:MAG: DarT ssDNA thymidine ADP-ribosyltransferase family protein [Capsulimonadaceae bacterium]